MTSGFRTKLFAAGLALGLTAAPLAAQAQSSSYMLASGASMSAVQSAIRQARDDAARNARAERPRHRHQAVRPRKPAPH